MERSSEEQMLGSTDWVTKLASDVNLLPKRANLSGARREDRKALLAAPTYTVFEDLQHHCSCMGWGDLEDHWPHFWVCPQDVLCLGCP